jgi:hypothetical protein
LQSESRGNFLLQALLAVALVMIFMPFLAQKLSSRKNDYSLNAIAQQTNSAVRAAREFIRVSKDNLAYGQQNIAGEDFSDLLEPFGLPLGFIPQTIIGQKISLLTVKNESEILSLIILHNGDLSEVKRRELISRIGPNAATSDKNGVLQGVGGWNKNLKDYGIKPDISAIYVLVSTNDDFSELVRRKTNDPDRSKFYTDLNMGNFSIKNITSLVSKNADLNNGNFNTLSIVGSSDNRRFKNKINYLTSDRAVFQSNNGDNPLNIYRGNLKTNSLSGRYLFKYGLPGYVYVNTALINSLSMSVGRTGFYGMYDWNVHSDVILNNISIDTEHIEINGFINASRGQDVFIDEYELTYATKSGIEAQKISTAFITLRDQVSSALLSGIDGAIVMDIRPAGVSVLPDVLSDTINNDEFQILKNPDLDDGEVVSCKTIISSLPSAPAYNSNSISQNIVCQFVFWQRLERRINIKQCKINGQTNCE